MLFSESFLTGTLTDKSGLLHLFPCAYRPLTLITVHGTPIRGLS
jgi:hypothetical protein